MIRKLKIVPFEAEHLLQMKIRNEESEPFDGKDFYEIAKQSDRELSFTFIDSEDSYIAFCLGVKKLWNGVGEAWSLCNEGIHKYIRELLYYSRLYIDKAFNDYGFHRLQAHVRADWIKSIMFDEKLGFVEEAFLEKYGPNGEDYILFGRVK